MAKCGYSGRIVPSDDKMTRSICACYNCFSHGSGAARCGGCDARYSARNCSGCNSRAASHAANEAERYNQSIIEDSEWLEEELSPRMRGILHSRIEHAKRCATAFEAEVRMRREIEAHVRQEYAGKYRK